MARNWTPAQTAAMSTLGRTLLISAAAGSGKTATLTERIIRRLTDPEQPAELSRLLIVTFTRAAAAELRERISAALSEAIAREPGNHHLQRQLIGLGNAHISTIDAFVREPVKAHFAELGLPAATRIADEAELLPLRERIMGEVMDEFYLTYASARTGDTFSLLRDNPFADLCDSLSSSKNDTDLIPTLLSLYERLLAFPQGLGRLTEEADALDAVADSDFFASDHGRMIAQWVAEFCVSAIETMQQAIEILSEDAAAQKAYGPAFEADLSFLLRLQATTTYADAYTLMQEYQSLRLGALRNAAPEFVMLKEARTAIVDDIKALRKAYFIDEPTVISAHMRKTAVLCRVLHDFLVTYDTRILAEKQARGITDFTDNRRYLLRLLRADHGAFAEEFRAQFDEVYIDEYQDVDELQDEIFRLVGGEHRFMVGDIKQSIYGFRGADPSVFAGYRRVLLPLSDAPESSGASIFMSDNFRCDEGVIRVTNAVCGHIFRACPDTVDYRVEDDLGFAKSKPTPDYASPPVEVAVLTKPPKTDDEPLDRESESGELSGVSVEATYVANAIADLLTSGATLADGRPITPGDIVILMRNRTGLSAYMQALTARGIPTGSEELDALNAERDLLHGTDMTYLVNLLRVIDNPHADIPLSEVLRAPFPGLDLDELLAVRRVGDRTAESQSLYMGLEEYSTQENADPLTAAKVHAFISWLDSYRALCTTQSADGILRRLRRDERVSARRSSAFLFLYEAARTYRTSTFVSLYSFLKYFEKKLETTTAVAPERTADGGAVSIMTIHKSKGLEFPVCFVVRCGQYFSNASTAKDLIFEQRVGVAMKLYQRGGHPEHSDQAATPVTSGKVDTSLRAAAALATRLSEREEEMRVLYVAMTRARERLYLVGMGNEKPVFFREGDRYATLSCNGYLPWILGGLAAHPEVSDFARVHYISMSDVVEGPRLPRATPATSQANPHTAAHYRAILEAHTEPDALETMIRHIPTKVPASRMRPAMLDTCVFYATDLAPDADGKLPLSGDGTWCDAQTTASIRESLRLMSTGNGDEFELLLAENRRPTPAERGTATHLFLQFCDYEHIISSGTPSSQAVLRAGIEQELERLLHDGFLSERAANILDRDMLTAFFKSRFFAHIEQAVHTERELTFSRFVPLAELTTHSELAAALGDRTLYVQGSIDLLAEFSDGHIELCDYKTDHITDAERANPSLLAARFGQTHGEQLRQYAAAVQGMYGRAPERVYIYSLPLGEAVEITLN